MYFIDQIAFHTNENYLQLEDKKISLDKQTSDILLLLIETKSPVSKATLISHIWQNRYVSDAAITSAIRRVRKAITELDDTQEYIKTISKVGYQLNVIVKNENDVKPIVSSGYSEYYRLKIIGILLIFLSSILYWKLSVEPSIEPPISYRQAIHLLAQKNEESLPQAIQLLENSIQEAPKFVAAYHTLSQLYAYKMSRHLGLSDQQIIAKATEYIQKTIELAPEHPDTLLSKAMLDYFYLRNDEGVKQYHQQVMEGLTCDHKCNFFLAYSLPIFNQSKLAIQYAEQAYQAQPNHATYLWERAWSQFMAGNFERTLTRIEEAEQFLGRTSFLFRAMLAQAQNQPKKAIINWLSYYQFIGKISENEALMLESRLEEIGYADVSNQLLDMLSEIVIDQEVELLLLAGKKEQAFNKVLATDNLQAQTYLIAMHVSPVFMVSFTQEELEVLRDHIWSTNKKAP
ncbi:winged helix-turn-helix domain-containing protein [Thalassotalea castellviae]|uniref:Winged helix-turn-helix domain-containing protein n=1 Tax=Thalassotalea castellviae TaxID=3075612 RepID=A0ABU3A173_9GAMM|nr:winged helix-turn-helix domain-containing protein [Thalassotalea sp. W431]MDT0603924.1 winged helix-turn-helix domain-containing protein [Thalassotalea sp. W431]